MSNQPDLRAESPVVELSWPQAGHVSNSLNIDSGGSSVQPTADVSSSTYKIGAVSRLTGITTHTLRKWENRYAMVAPERTAGGDRLYSRKDVRKLLLVKDLIRAGMALAKVAGMSIEALANANNEVFAVGSGSESAGAAQVAAAPEPKVARKIEAVIVGPTLPHTLGDGLGLLDHFSVRLTTGAATDLLARESCPPTDALVWECPHLQLEDRDILLAMMARTQAVFGIVIFGFGARDHVSALRSRNVSLLRGPLDTDEVQRIALGMMYDLRWHHSTEY